MKKPCVQLILLIYLSCISGEIFAQNKGSESCSIIYNQVDKDNPFSTGSLLLTTSFKSCDLAEDYIQKLPEKLLFLGFPASSIDTFSKTVNGFTADIYLGNRYSNFILNTDSIEPIALENSGYMLKNLNTRSFSPTSLTALQKNLLKYYANHGYPFAVTTLDNIRFGMDSIFGDLKVDKKIEYKIDSFRIIGTANLSAHFLQQELTIKNSSLYNKNKLTLIDQKLSALPYVKVVQPSDITMLGTGSVVNLYLDEKKSSQVDFLIGFLPNSTVGGKTQITGDVNLDLKNLLGNGENFLLRWQALQPRSPRLNLGFDQPYILNSNFGVNFLFDLYKRDSNYLQVNAQAGIQFVIRNVQTGKLYLRLQKNSLLQGGVDTSNVIQSKTLPADADVSAVSAGFIYELQGTNYKLNPRRGNEIFINTSVGTKRIKINNEISQIKDPAFNYASLYDSISAKTFQFRIKASGSHYFPWGKRAVLKTQLQGGWYASPNIFRNELFLIGGSKLMRGFNDEEFFARQYGVATVEYRYLVGQNSNLYTFIDLGIAQNNFLKQQVTNRLAGAGIGLLNETKIGLINISVAAGKRNDIPFNLREAVKLHFGYINFF